MAIGIGLAILAAAQAAPAQPQSTHPPDIEARLAKVVGDWTIAGQEATYRETCAWYGPRAFVVCDTVDTADGYRGRSILGYSRDRQRFTYHNYGFSGSSRSELGFPHGATASSIPTSGRQRTGWRASPPGSSRRPTDDCASGRRAR